MTDPKHEQTPRRYQAPRFPQGRFAVENADDGFPVGVFSGGHEILPYTDDEPPADSDGDH
jgi:hypothetical protein